ncbi:MAG TPA: hypothetical protein VFS15_08350 [Kofleriaceae bacterium]|nr:hypothetical protein [Kofleriaceae bacterium]
MDDVLVPRASKSSAGQGRVTAPLPGFFYAPPADAMVPFFEHDEDPKKPRPVHVQRKQEGWMEVDESRKDDDRDRHRHVHVRC